jgi:CRISPR-associated protein Cas1
MKVTIIDKKDAILKVDNKTLKVDTQKIPLRLVDTLIIASSHSIETKELIKITKEGISIIILSYLAKDSAIITSTIGKNAEVKLSQFNAQKNSLSIAKYFISQKLISHTKHLKLHGTKMELDKALIKIQDAETLQTLLGIEGSFSKGYFSHYFKLFPKRLHDNKRTKNPPLDPVNALMSFLYMLFYNLISIKLISFGFEPSIGFLHKPFRSHNALSSDFMELIRSDINEFVFLSFKNEIIKHEDFTKNNGVYLKYEGRKKIWSSLKPFIDALNPKLDANIANLRSML